ncbi:Bifunctional aspartokinase/homoserine dehydrogenase 1 [bacterium HR26]|nr:Bifunctional aspartokinase/homoserine dehydrogenase 1 [bacterium HR26]
MRVMKFGGTSVGNAEAIDQTARILAEAYRSGDPVVAVVSAMSGVTNQLLASAAAAAAGQGDAGSELRQHLLDRHLAVVAELVHDLGRRAQVTVALEELASRCARLVESVHILGDLSSRAQDWIVSFGERMSSVLVASVLEDRGIPAVAVESDQVIVTDDAFGNASPLLDQTRARAQERLGPLLAERKLPVVTGYFGATASRSVTTLGRGGSDYSASILGYALDADEVWIWTDVDGVMTADPRLVPEARTLPSISFAEATELAYFGAKVIHPRTMQPAAERGIPIWIKNTFRPEHPGTRIGPETTQDGSVVKAITAIPGVSVITVEGSGFLSVADVTARVFDTVGETGVNVYMIFQASSQHSLGFVVRQADAAKVLAALEQEFELDLLKGRVLRIWEDPNLAVVAVVGAGMRGTPGVAGRVFQTLGQNRINIVAIAQGSSELNISFVIAEHEVSRAVPAIHAAFGLGKARDA